MVPETKGRSLEEIDEMFQNKVPIRGFKNYTCISSETAREIAKKSVEPDGLDMKTHVTERTGRQQ